MIAFLNFSEAIERNAAPRSRKGICGITGSARPMSPNIIKKPPRIVNTIRFIYIVTRFLQFHFSLDRIKNALISQQLVKHLYCILIRHSGNKIYDCYYIDASVGKILVYGSIV